MQKLTMLANIKALFTILCKNCVLHLCIQEVTQCSSAKIEIESILAFLDTS